MSEDVAALLERIAIALERTNEWQIASLETNRRILELSERAQQRAEESYRESVESDETRKLMGLRMIDMMGAVMKDAHIAEEDPPE